MRSIESLIRAVETEARRADFPIDEPVYAKAGKDPLVPVMFAGWLASPVCVIGRDLGRDEVAAGQPLIGAGGRLVRAGVYRAWNGTDPPATDRRLESVLDRVLLTNLVPFKPPGNKAYPTAVRERFRPFLAELLVHHWRGSRVLTLGTEAFHWFSPYAGSEVIDGYWRREDRYEAELECTVVVQSATGTSNVLRVGPLPHPSPLNARWYRRFPELLARRLAALPEA